MKRVNGREEKKEGLFCFMLTVCRVGLYWLSGAQTENFLLCFFYHLSSLTDTFLQTLLTHFMLSGTHMVLRINTSWFMDTRTHKCESCLSALTSTVCRHDHKTSNTSHKTVDSCDSVFLWIQNDGVIYSHGSIQRGVYNYLLACY